MERIKILKNGKTNNIKLQITSTDSNLGLFTEVGEEKNIGSGNLTITGTTTSKLESVKTFDYQNPYKIGVNGVTDITPTFTAYTINQINYVTDSSGKTTFSLIKPNENYVSTNNIFEEEYLKQAFLPNLDNQINIDRQNISVVEVIGRFHLLKSVNSIDQYNNNFFHVSNQ